MVLQSIKRLLFPDICASCKTFTKVKDRPLCERCRPQITLSQTLVCGQCRARLAENKKICHPQSYALGITTSYHNQITHNTLHSFKFKYVEETAPFLASLLVDFIRQLDPLPKIIKESPLVTHVPLSKERLRERGFDQSQLIAKHFTKQMNLDHQTLLTKTTNPPPQSLTESKEERRKNIKDAFIATAPAVRQTPLIVIDDIVTTGSTLDEAVKTLRQARL